MTVGIIIFVLSLVLAYLGVERFRRWSVRKDIIDVPNERSSHSEPTPRGGGLIILVLCLLVYSTVSAVYPSTFSWAFLVGSLMIGAISWLDDIRSISVVWRFMVHAAAALMVIVDRGYWDSVMLWGSGDMAWLGIVGSLLTFAWIVWMINAYNFMDGIDGIAGIQALAAALGWCVLGYVLGRGDILFLGSALAGSSLGFLIHNWPPAKIFMGDVGSAFLGFTFAVFPLLASDRGSGGRAALVLPAAAFVWLFLFDTVVTFARRLLKRHRVWTAHREHLYQRMVIRGSKHQTVSIVYGSLAAAGVVAGLYAYIYPRGFSLFAILTLIVISMIVTVLASIKKRIDVSN